MGNVGLCHQRLSTMYNRVCSCTTLLHFISVGDTVLDTHRQRIGIRAAVVHPNSGTHEQ